MRTTRCLEKIALNDGPSCMSKSGICWKSTTRLQADQSFKLDRCPQLWPNVLLLQGVYADVHSNDSGSAKAGNLLCLASDSDAFKVPVVLYESEGLEFSTNKSLRPRNTSLAGTVLFDFDSATGRFEERS